MVLLQLLNGLEVHLGPWSIMLLKLGKPYIRYNIYFDFSLLYILY